METEVVSGMTAYGPGYISEDLKGLEKVVGLQTDKPLKRAFMPYGGIKMAEQACTTYGYTPSPKLHEIFTKYARTHNTAVFDAYTPEMKKARHSHIVTGLPDTYGRGRIVGDYRRVALYGIDYLIKEKQNDFANCGDGTMTDDVIRLREEIALQIRALNDMKAMAAAYGYDISLPAANAKEAVLNRNQRVPLGSKQECGRGVIINQRVQVGLLAASDGPHCTQRCGIAQHKGVGTLCLGQQCAQRSNQMPTGRKANGGDLLRVNFQLRGVGAQVIHCGGTIL